MSPLHPLFAVIIFSIAFLTAYLIRIKYKIDTPPGRYECIDGLRGFLALGVFIHHTTVWHQYLHTGNWEAPKSNLYNQLGLVSVSLFFMITSFLFITKLLNAGKNGFNWRDFFISRIFRLMPMYYFSVVVIFLLIMVVSRWQLNCGATDFIMSVFHWGLFTIYKYPLINNYAFTHHVNAGVFWSLPYEWMFYFSLPLIALLLKIKPPKTVIIGGFAFLVSFYIYHGIISYHVFSFLGGAIAPFLIKYGFNSRHAIVKNPWISTVILICLFLIIQFSSVNNILCILLIAVVFTFIAMGNTVFGILKHPTLLFLGEVCYSTYLLHGIILFASFYWLVGINNVTLLPPTQYCIVIFMITPFIVLFSFLGFKYIEKPGIDRAKYLREKWRTARVLAG